jgi:hypothetical protein
VSEYGGTGKDFMIGKIYLTKLKSCRCLDRGQKTREPNRRKMRKYVEGRNPQTVSRGKFTRAAALVASAHPKSHPKKKKMRDLQTERVGSFSYQHGGYGAAV